MFARCAIAQSIATTVLYDESVKKWELIELCIRHSDEPKQTVVQPLATGDNT